MADRPARCECTGECGHSHGWTAEQPAQLCRAPSGCQVQRKKGQPSCWILAGTDRIPLAYPEHYDDRVGTVTLEPVQVGNVVKHLCGFCRVMLQKKTAR